MMIQQNKKEQKDSGRVIVTYGRSLISLVIAHSLGLRGVEVIGCDDAELTVLSFSKYVTKNHVYTNPQENPEQFITDLKTIVQEHKPEDERPYILMPGFNEARIIARHAREFEGLITLACPSDKAIDQIYPKDNFFKTVSELNLPIPQTLLPGNRQELEDHIKELSFPVFIKPPHESGGRGISKHDDTSSLLEAYDVLVERFPDKQIIVQEAHGGKDYCYCGLYHKGRNQASMVYHNLLKYPADSGPGVVRETVSENGFTQVADKLMRTLEWTGVIELDFLWTGEEMDQPVLIEANPRFWSGIDHSVKSGIDFPYLLYCIAKGEPCTRESETSAAEGHKTSLPGLSSMARIDHIFSEALRFEKLEKSWPMIKKHINNKKYYEAGIAFKEAMKESMSPGEALEAFKTLRNQAREIENLPVIKEDPFAGLGILYVIAYLIRNGALPPELKRN